jgi:hypothetical protein
MGSSLPLPLQIGLSLALAASVQASDHKAPCFDFEHDRVVEPLRPLLAPPDGGDSSAFGDYPGGVAWAARRTIVEMPIRTVYEKLLDHRNVKDMKKTTLSTTTVERPGYMQFHLVDIVVRLRALFVKMKIAWTEAWAYCLTDGSEEDPRSIVVSYQKVAGSHHIERQCGSYVLQAREDGTTDLSMYEEIKASRRSARDTRDMHIGILRNIRGTNEAQKR